MHPYVGQGPPECSFSLGNFIFMMGKLEVRAPAMNVQRQSQQLFAHGGALNVPPGPAQSIRRLPFGFFRLFGLCGFPEDKVQRITLGGSDGNPFSSPEVIERFAGQLPIARKLSNGIVHIAIIGLVGKSLVFKLGDNVEHLADMLGRPGLCVGGSHTKSELICMHGVDVEVRDLVHALTGLHSLADDLVIDVGNVAHVLDLIAGCTQPALDHVKAHQHPGMAQVTEIIDGHAADVHTDAPRLHRFERLFGARKSVINVQHAQRTIILKYQSVPLARSSGASRTRKVQDGTNFVPIPSKAKMAVDKYSKWASYSWVAIRPPL